MRGVSCYTNRATCMAGAQQRAGVGSSAGSATRQQRPGSSADRPPPGLRGPRTSCRHSSGVGRGLRCSLSGGGRGAVGASGGTTSCTLGGAAGATAARRRAASPIRTPLQSRRRAHGAGGARAGATVPRGAYLSARRPGLLHGTAAGDCRGSAATRGGASGSRSARPAVMTWPCKRTHPAPAPARHLVGCRRRAPDGRARQPIRRPPIRRFPLAGWRRRAAALRKRCGGHRAARGASRRGAALPQVVRRARDRLEVPRARGGAAAGRARHRQLRPAPGGLQLCAAGAPRRGPGPPQAAWRARTCLAGQGAAGAGWRRLALAGVRLALAGCRAPVCRLAAHGLLLQLLPASPCERYIILHARAAGSC